MVPISAQESGLPEESFVNTAQILTVDKERLLRKAGHLSFSKMREVDQALNISLGL